MTVSFAGRVPYAATLQPFLVLFACILLCSSCGRRGSLLPASGGRAFEVLLVCDDSAAAAVTDSALSIDVEGLPQREPCFDVSTTDSEGLNATTRLTHAIVVVETDGGNRRTVLQYEKDAFAQPQMLVRITTTSADALREDVGQWGRRLRLLLDRAETNRAITAMTDRRNHQAATLVEQVFGCTMTIPEELTASKRGKAFVWLSNNTPQGMRNICIYQLPGKVNNASDFAKLRDSTMRRNIPGERKGTFMKTATLPEQLAVTKAKEKGRPERTIVRGLWEMEGDMMGGPFVAHIMHDSTRQCTFVAEAFVFAPEQKKRNLLRLTEAALYTFNF